MMPRDARAAACGRQLNFMLTRLLTALLALAAIATPLLAQKDDDINWLGSYDEAIRVARQTGKPIFLEFRCEP